MGLILLIVLLVLLIGAVPTWPHSRQWGYAPSGGLGTILLIVLILVLLGYIPGAFLSESSGHAIVAFYRESRSVGISATGWASGTQE